MKLKKAICVALLSLGLGMCSVRAVDTPLHDVVFSGNIAAIEAFCKTNAVWLTEQNQQGVCPIHIAVDRGNLDVLKCLVEKCGASVEQRDARERTAIHWAAYHGKIDMVRYLVEECHADVNAKDYLGRTPFLLALAQSKLDVAQYLTEHGAYITACDKDRCGAIFYGIYSQNMDVLRYLVEKSDVPLNVMASKCCNPLHVIARNGDTVFADYLLSDGVTKPFITDRVCAMAFGEIPCDDDLMCDEPADFMDPFDIIKQDFAKGGEAEREAEAERVKSRLQVFKKMLNKGNENFQTPLHDAVRFHQPNMVEYLVERNVDINAKDILGRTPLVYAVLTKQIDVVRCLIKHGADANLKDNNGVTALHCATQMGCCAIAHYLVETGGAKVDEEDSTGRSPLDLARGMGLSWLADYYATKLYRKHHLEMFSFSYGFNPGIIQDSELTH